MSSALAVSALLFAGSNSWAQSVNLTIGSGSLFVANSTNSPSGGACTTGFNCLAGWAVCPISLGDHYYATQQFTAPSTGSYTIATTAANFAGASRTDDSFIAVYSTFNPANPHTGLAASASCSDAGGASNLSSMSVNLTAGTYTAVVTAYQTGSAPSYPGYTGTATLSFTPAVTIGGGSGTVSAPIDLHFSKQPKTISTEIEIK